MHAQAEDDDAEDLAHDVFDALDRNLAAHADASEGDLVGAVAELEESEGESCVGEIEDGEAFARGLRAQEGSVKARLHDRSVPRTDGCDTIFQPCAQELLFPPCYGFFTDR